MSNMVIYGYGFSFKHLSSVRGNLHSIACVTEETDQLHPDEGLMLVYHEGAYQFLKLLSDGAPVPDNVLLYGDISNDYGRTQERFPHTVSGSVWDIEPLAWKYGIRSRRAVLEAEIRSLTGTRDKYYQGKLREAKSALREFEEAEKAGAIEEESLKLTLVWSQDTDGVSWGGNNTKGWKAICPEFQCHGYGRTKEEAKADLCERISCNARDEFYHGWHPEMGKHMASLVMVYEDRLAEVFTEVDQEPALI